jgi:hypothetical protein
MYHTMIYLENFYDIYIKVRLQKTGCLLVKKRTVFCRNIRRNIQRYWILRRLCRSISCSASNKGEDMTNNQVDLNQLRIGFSNAIFPRRSGSRLAAGAVGAAARAAGGSAVRSGAEGLLQRF